MRWFESLCAHPQNYACDGTADSRQQEPRACRRSDYRDDQVAIRPGGSREHRNDELLWDGLGFGDHKGFRNGPWLIRGHFWPRTKADYFVGA